MAIAIERVARCEHKQDTVKVDDAFLHPDAGEAKDIAHHHHGELDQDHEQSCPGDDPSRAIGERINPIGNFSERSQNQPRASVNACSAMRVHSREASSEALKLS